MTNGGLKTFKGTFLTLLGACFWGLSGSCIQYLQSAYQIDALFLATIRMLIGGLIFLIPIMLRYKKEFLGLMHSPKDLCRTALFGSAGLMFCQLTYILTIGYTNAGVATVLQMLNVVFVLAIVCIVVHRLPRAMEILGVILALVGTVLIATKGDLGTLNIPLEGLIWGIISAATVTLYVMYPRRLFAKWGSVPVTGVGMFIGGLAALILDIILKLVFDASGGLVGYVVQIPALGLDGIIALIVIIVFGTCGSFGLFLYGVSIVGGVKGSLLGAAEPICAAVISSIWLGTSFGWADWLGLILMIATTFVVTLMGEKD